MMLIAALLAMPLGMVLAAVMMVALASALSLNFLLAGASLLPPPLANVIQTALASQLITSWLGVLIVLLVWIGVTFFLYWIASANVTLPAPPASGLATTNAAENIARGALIGVCGGANFAVLTLLIGGAPFGTLVALLISAIGLLSAVPALSNNPVFQIVVGWTTLALPMAWPMTLLGWLSMTINAAVAALGGPTVAFIALWTRGNLIMHGGVVQGCFRNAPFNLGNFTIAHRDVGLTTPWFTDGAPVWPFCPAAPGLFTGTVMGVALHESTHELNLGAFGWIYHLIGFVDQFLPMPWSGAPLPFDAHAELCAESGLRGFGRNFLDMWLPAPAPPAGPAPASNVPAIAVATLTPPAGAVVTALPDPVAATGMIVACTVNTNLTFSSAASVDPDAFPLPTIGRFWRVFVRPPGSTAVVLGTTTGAPTDIAITFAPDAGPRFSLTLTVTDGVDGLFAPGQMFLPIGIEVVSAVFAAVPPGPPSGVPLQLDGTASTDAVNGVATPLTHSWLVTSTPPGSALLGTVLTGATPTFTPDVAPAGVASWAIDLTVTTVVSPAGGGAPVNLASTSRLSF